MTSVSEKYSSHLNCSITAGSESFCYIHMHTEEMVGADYLKRVHECTEFLFQLIGNNYFSPPVVDNLRAIIDRDQKKFAEKHSLSFNSKPIEVIAKYKRATTKEYDGKGKHLKYKDGVLTCTHFKHPEKNFGGRSTIELVSLVKRHQTCINEIKEEFCKLKEEYPALSEVQVVPWQSDEIELDHLQKRLSSREDASEALDLHTRSSYFEKGNPIISQPQNIPKEFDRPSLSNSLNPSRPKQNTSVLTNGLESEEPKRPSVSLTSTLKITTDLTPLKLMSNPYGLTPIRQVPSTSLPTSLTPPIIPTPSLPFLAKGLMPLRQVPSTSLPTNRLTPLRQLASSPTPISEVIPLNVMPALPAPRNDLSLHLENALRERTSFQSTLFYHERKYIEISELKERFIEQEKGSPKGVDYTVDGSTITVTHFHDVSASPEVLANCLKSQKAAFGTFKPLLEIIQKSDQLSLERNFVDVLASLRDGKIITALSHKRTLHESLAITSAEDEKTQDLSLAEDSEKQDFLPPPKKPRCETESKE